MLYINRDVPTYGIYTWAYEFLMHYFYHAHILSDITRQILAGGCAGNLFKRAYLQLFYF